jgi:uncharacterized membrane protein required for colicin V production
MAACFSGGSQRLRLGAGDLRCSGAMRLLMSLFHAARYVWISAAVVQALAMMAARVASK